MILKRLGRPPAPQDLARRGRRPLRVFLGPTEIAGYYKALEVGLRSLGVSATATDLSEHPFRYEGAAATPVPLMARPAIAARRRWITRSKPGRIDLLIHRLARVPLFLWALWRFDVFVLSGGQSFFRGLDLPILNWFGKRIIAVFHGSDLRPPYMDGPTMGAWTGRSIADCARLTAEMKRSIRRIERHASVVVAHPMYSHFLERPYIRFLALGVPLQRIPPSQPASAPMARVRILHSPSHPQVKGTGRVRAAVDQLLAEGLPIDYVEVVGQPNAVVLRELSRADFVIDQLYSDTPMASFATEAGGLGRPAVVGSCCWEEILRVTPVEEVGPVMRCDPEGVVAATRLLVEDANVRQELGARARSFVAGRSDPRDVAARLMTVIEGRTPPDWLSTPQDVRHLCGVGLSSDRVQEVVRELVERFGPPALQLTDKPELESLMVAWAQTEHGAADLSSVR